MNHIACNRRLEIEMLESRLLVTGRFYVTDVAQEPADQPGRMAWERSAGSQPFRGLNLAVQSAVQANRAGLTTNHVDNCWT